MSCIHYANALHAVIIFIRMLWVRRIGQKQLNLPELSFLHILDHINTILQNTNNNMDDWNITLTQWVFKSIFPWVPKH